MGTEKLWIIRAKLWDTKISLKEVKNLWFEAKNIILSADYLSSSDVEVSVKIFNKGQEIVGNFWQKWLDKKVQPTDEELYLLEEAFNEASWAFNFLTTNYSTIFPSKDNQVSQKKIMENKQIISEEKVKRKKLGDLQSELNSLKNQPNDNEDKIKDLQRQIDELKNKGDIPPKEQKENNQREKQQNENSFLWIIIIMLILGMIFIVFNSKKKPKT